MDCHSRRAAVTHKTRQTQYSFVLQQPPEGVVTWSQQRREKGTETDRQVRFQTIACGTIANHTLAKQTKGGKMALGRRKDKVRWKQTLDTCRAGVSCQSYQDTALCCTPLGSHGTFTSFWGRILYRSSITWLIISRWPICYYLRDIKIIRIELLKNAETMNWWNNKDFYRLSCSTW